MGRRDKGPRKQLAFLVPLPLYEEIVAKAEEVRVTINDFAAALLALTHRRPLPTENLVVWAGERELVAVRVPVATADEVADAARDAGLSIRDYGAVRLAEALGRPLMVASPRDNQRELDLAFAAGT